MGKVLSVVIPTLNRYEYLRRTLDYVIPQVQKHLDKVELVICCNASKDKTDEYIKSLLPQYPFIKYKYFDEYVEVGQSLIRSVGEASGEYVVLWGDDDIPFPSFTDTILEIIEKNPKVGIIHCNRLAGKDTKYGMRDVHVQEKKLELDEEGIYPIDKFVERFTISLGFISSLVFRKDGWNKGIPYYNDQYFGYEHLSIIVNGNKDKQCYYYPHPLEYQRLPYERDFSVKWPLYKFVGVPNMMADYDKNGVTHNALEEWHKAKNASFPRFVWDMMYTSQDKSFFRPICKELNKYQKSAFRRCLTYIIVYTCPKSLFSFLKKRLYK